ncbi:D-alanyl-D-alanine dipeptidase [Oceanisphaera litoralis]|uniref:M15 family metallopeptidase n=1 Tax=Oceanisphaera litoralis TaxID=225144 RepID=UPI00195B9B08|nr:M15 family metallopeptidase [Oceanisphaera litoralis]MBM7456455.1 D-alanyl-D-alanine dipeptidase [Oceanisphaera litoralis]
MNFLSQAILAQPEPNWPQLHSLPIAESDEPLVPLGLVTAPLRVYPAYFHLGVPGALSDCYVRRSVSAQLHKAARLLPAGIELVVLDGWRPLMVQQYLFNTLSAAMREHHAGDSEAELLARTRHFVAPPSSSPEAPSPHLTGGSVDVTLCDGEGNQLDMGTEFDDISPWSYSAAFEAIGKPSPREADVIENRRLLHSVMTHVGFTNLASEWWHFDYGNQSWAWHSNAAEAKFGAASLVPLEQRWLRQVANLVQ